VEIDRLVVRLQRLENTTCSTGKSEKLPHETGALFGSTNRRSEGAKIQLTDYLCDIGGYRGRK